MATALDDETRKKTQVSAPAFPQSPPPGGSIYAGARRPDRAMRDALPAAALAADQAKERVAAAFQQGNTAAGVGQIVRGAATTIGTTAKEVGGNLIGAAADVAGAVAKPVAQVAYTAFTGNNDEVFAGGATPSPATPQAPTSQRASLPSPTPGTGSVGTGARAANSLDNLNARAASPAPGQSSAAPTVDPDSPQARGYTQIGPDIYRKGNSFSDEAATREGGFGARAPVTAQANTAAENVAGGFGANQQALARMQAANAAPSSAPGLGIQMPTLRHSGNDWQARTDLRNARVSANSLSNDGRWGGRGGKSPDVLAYEAALATDEAAKQGKNPLAQEMLQQQGGVARTQIQDAGATQRAAIGEQGANTRAGMTNEVQRGELDVKRGEFGVRSRAARQIQEAQQAYLGATTPEARARAAQNLRVLSGNGEEVSAKDRYIRTGGGQSVIDGSTVREPERIFDTVTRQYVNAGQSAQAKPLPSKDKLVPGATYETARGPGVWDGKQFTLVR